MATKPKKGRFALVALLFAALLAGGFTYVVTREFVVAQQQVDKELPNALLLGDA